MTKFNNNQSDNLFSQVFGVAKKLSSTGLSILQQNQSGDVSKVIEPIPTGKTVEGRSRTKSPFEVEQYESPQQMLREHLPKVTRQVFGRHFKKSKWCCYISFARLGCKKSQAIYLIG